MNKGVCGIDCEKCDCYIASVNNDDDLREKTAILWSKLNNASIAKDMINCFGCLSLGEKCYYCAELCAIRKCALSKKYMSCSQCLDRYSCDKLALIINNNKDLFNN